MSGWTSPTDSARIDWKQGGKIVATSTCALGRDGDYAAGDCKLEKSIKAKGAIDAELILASAWFYMVSPRVALVDVRLTKDSSTVDERINPAALKKSMAFGLPWPDHPKVKTIHASYPPKSGLPDPK